MHCFASFNFPPLHIIKLGLDILKYEPFIAHSFHYMPTPIKGGPRAWCRYSTRPSTVLGLQAALQLLHSSQRFHSIW